jgi:hypothetical protein
MTDEKKVETAFDMLEDAEVMHEFDDSVWIKVDRELWEAFNNSAPTTAGIQPDCGTPALREMQDRIDKAIKDTQC